MSFDPFGSRRQSNWREATVGINLIPVLTNRGFTGHEHIDEMDLIHMNGRVYDPTLGRFLSADPHIQSPYSTQSYNRYSYVSNNPLKYTDPSGYFLGGLFKAIGKAFKAIGNFVKKYWRQIVSIVIMVYMPGLLLEGMNPILQGAIAGAAAGFVSTGSLKGAVLGGISGAAFGALHGMDGGALGSLESFKKIAAHGLVGGITGKMQGGKFGHGFLSAAFSQAAAIGAKGTGLFKEATGKVLKAAERAHNAIVAGVIGGTASVLGGGKFMNGAVTGAYSQLLNDSAFSEGCNKDGTCWGVTEKEVFAKPTGNTEVFWDPVRDTDFIDISVGDLLLASRLPGASKFTKYFTPSIGVATQTGIQKYEYQVYKQKFFHVVDGQNNVLSTDPIGRPYSTHTEFRVVPGVNSVRTRYRYRLGVSPASRSMM
jgi:RHS repeat-associated protein